MTAQELVQRICRERVAASRSKVRKPSFSLERGKGETYSHARPVLYAHSVYPRSSCLGGQPSRTWIDTWDSWDEARTVLAEVKRLDPSFKYDDYGSAGTTHTPVASLIAHLPDDTDY